MAGLLLLLLAGVRGEIRVVSSSANRSLVPEGGSVELTCESDRPWFLCLWRSPRGDKQCAIQEDGSGARTTVCQGDPRVELEGGPTNCTIRLREARAEDWGAWMCLLQDGQQFQTDRRLLELEVARRGRLRLVVGGGPVEGTLLRLTEGETVEVECRVEGAFPRPVLSWRGPGVGNVTLTEAGRHLYDDDQHVYLSQSTIQYRASINDTNATLSCRAEQLDASGQLLYGPSAQVRLEVEPLPQPLPYSLTTRVGVISGILLTLVFLLLVCVLVTAVMCRRQRREQASQPDTSDYQTDSLQPVWTTSRWPSLPSSKKREACLVSAAPSYSVVNLSSEGGGGLQSTPTSHLSSSASILTDSSPPRGLSLRPAPSLHETHFSSVQDQPPVTLLHPPGLFLQLGPRKKVSSSQSEGFPCCTISNFGSRPVSSMGLSLLPDGRRDMQKLSIQTLPGYRPSSSSSLFDCPHECFVERRPHTHAEEEEESLNNFAKVVQQELEEALNSMDNM